MNALAVVIPTRNGYRTVRAALRSLSPLPADVVVVDNASTDGTPAVVRQENPGARLIILRKNQGFAAACNRGIRESTNPYALLLNQDALVIPDGIAVLLAHLERHPRCAAAGGRINNPDGKLQPSMGPPPHPLRAVLDRLPGLRNIFDSHVYRNPRTYAAAREPAWLTGACLLLRRAAIEDVGPLDEGYFMYTEDLDWCVRARKRGWALQYLPVRTAVHADEGRSPRHAQDKARWMREGLLRYFAEHGTRTQAHLFRFLLAAERRVRARTETVP